MQEISGSCTASYREAVRHRFHRDRSVAPLARLCGREAHRLVGPLLVQRCGNFIVKKNMKTNKVEVSELQDKPKDENTVVKAGVRNKNGDLPSPPRTFWFRMAWKTTPASGERERARGQRVWVTKASAATPGDGLTARHAKRYGREDLLRPHHVRHLSASKRFHWPPQQENVSS